MKKLLFALTAFFFTTFSFLLPPPVFSAGQPCCTAPYEYNAADNNCVYILPNVGTVRAPKSIGCFSQEYCDNGTCAVDQTPHNISCQKDTDCPQGTCQDIGPTLPSGQRDAICVDSGGNQITTTIPIEPSQCWNNGVQGVDTAIGCIPIETGPFVNYLLTRAISIGGGVAFLIMLFGAFTLITSGGNPENIKKGQELITSAIAGLILILGSVFLLRLIGIDILNLDIFS